METGRDEEVRGGIHRIELGDPLPRAGVHRKHGNRMVGTALPADEREVFVEHADWSPAGILDSNLHRNHEARDLVLPPVPGADVGGTADALRDGIRGGGSVWNDAGG